MHKGIEVFKVLKVIAGIIVSLLLLFLIYKVNFIKEILLVVLCSFIIAYALRPSYCYIITKTKLNKRIVAISIIVLVILFFSAMISLLIPRILSESLNVQELLEVFELGLQMILDKFNIEKETFYEIINAQFGEKINSIITSISTEVFYGSIMLMENIIALAVVPVVAYYFLVESALINNKIVNLIPTDKRDVIKNIIKDIDRVLGKYVLGQGVLCLIIAILSFLGLCIIDIRFALLLSLINGILNIIPYFGPILGMVPAVLVALIDGPTKVIAVIIVFIIIQQIEGNILAPKVTANSISMHPLTIIILLLIGEKIGGILGMILIVPIAIIIKVLYDDLDYYCF